MPFASKLLSCVVVLFACTTSLAEVKPGPGKFEDTAELRGARLQLNGAGTRYRGPFKVYAAGLYLSRKAATPEEVLASAGVKRLAVTMLRGLRCSVRRASRGGGTGASVGTPPWCCLSVGPGVGPARIRQRMGYASRPSKCSFSRQSAGDGPSQIRMSAA